MTQGKQGIRGQKGEQGEEGKRSPWTLRGVIGVVLGLYICAALTVLIILVLPSLGTNDDQNKKLQQQNIALIALVKKVDATARTNTVALCGLRADLERRVEAAKRFLKQHPEGLPAFGLTAAQIAHEAENQERSVGSLEVLTCKGDV